MIRTAARIPGSTIILALVLLTQTGCSTLQYYGQAITGHARILFASTDSARIIADDRQPTRLRERLRLAIAIRRFASDRLGLPDNASYTRYAAIDRDYVMWNVFAAPELSLEPKTWCYPIVGCLAYRGYYRREHAIALAERLREAGMDVYVAPVAAYSTLGWFADPVLSSMLRWPDTALARVIFHELAHQNLYVRDATDLNEAYATAVAQLALDAWLAAHPETPAMDEALNRAERDASFVRLLEPTLEELRGLYANEQPATSMLAGKAAALARLRSRYAQWRERWNDYRGMDRWMGNALNNAGLASVATYHALVPALLCLAGTDGSAASRTRRLTARVTRLAALETAARDRCLQHLDRCPGDPVPTSAATPCAAVTAAL